MKEQNTYLITLHSINNPGSALQAYALNRYLNKNNIKNEIIDYRPYYSKIGTEFFKGIMRFFLFYKNEYEINKKYSLFMKNMILSNKKYYFYYQLKKNPPLGSCYITGSDQLWNPDYKCGRDKAYTLEFIDTRKKIAFSTSAGKKNLSKIELTNLCKRIKQFSNISVREKATSEQLSEFLHRNVTWVCDPVFLLDKKDYMKFCSNNKYGEYVVMYLASSSPLLDEYISYLKKEKGFILIQAGGNIKRCECDIHLKNIGPEEFITLIYHAKFIISGSFHATAFSLMMEKNFSTFLPKENGERILSILNLVGLEKRVIESSTDFEHASKHIDYEDIRLKLNVFINTSKEWLKNALREINE